MSIQDILNTTAHRPWELPKVTWTYYQEWNNALFLHWEADASALKRLIPAELELDLFDGKPWISLVAFTMNNIRPRYLPPFAPVSDFHEINIRTYVRKNAKSGVYFLSIEGSNAVSCEVARILSKLPYRHSRITRNENEYHSQNTPFSDKLFIRYDVGKKLTAKNDRDKWLTERYALYQDTAKSIHEFEIHHIEWPLHVVNHDQLEVTYLRFNELLNGAPDCAHFSAGVQVIAWNSKSERRKINTEIAPRNQGENYPGKNTDHPL
jgi:uncharacterized protein